MTIQRLENVGIAIDDLAAAASFFIELGLKCSVRCRSRAGHACGADWLTAPDANSLAITLGPPVGLRSETPHNRYVRLVRSPLGIGAPATRPAASPAAMACSSTVIGERPCSSAARSTSSNSGVTCQIVPW
jgi:hypothetical protein